MYTLREHTQTAADFESSLRKTAEIGYPAVQLSAIGAMNGDKPEVDAATARKMLDDHGLACIATHRPLKALLENTGAEIEFHKTLGCDYVAVGGAGDYERTYAGYRKFLSDIAPMIARLKAAGIRFGHHNHSFEFFRPERHGQTLEDILIEEGGPDLHLEFDLYWAEHAGLNCTTLLRRTAGRVPVIHVKDKECTGEHNETRMAPIGEGNMDWDGILPACREAGVEWYAVEQDQCYRDPFDCLKSSFDYLTGKGL